MVQRSQPSIFMHRQQSNTTHRRRQNNSRQYRYLLWQPLSSLYTPQFERLADYWQHSSNGYTTMVHISSSSRFNILLHLSRQALSAHPLRQAHSAQSSTLMQQQTCNHMAAHHPSTPALNTTHPWENELRVNSSNILRHNFYIMCLAHTHLWQALASGSNRSGVNGRIGNNSSNCNHQEELGSSTAAQEATEQDIRRHRCTEKAIITKMRMRRYQVFPVVHTINGMC